MGRERRPVEEEGGEIHGERRSAVVLVSLEVEGGGWESRSWWRSRRGMAGRASLCRAARR